MASLNGQAINATYEGLVKLVDNAGVTGTSKALTDGAGTLLPVEVSTSGMTYSGTQDFSGATVVGISGGGGTVIANTTKATSSLLNVDEVYKSILIPANTFGAGDIVKVEALLNIEMSNGGFVYWSAWIGPATTFLSGFPIGGGAQNVGTPGMAVVSKHLYIYTADGTGDATSFLSDTTAVEESAVDGFIQYNDSNVRAIDWTVDQYLNFPAYVENAGNFVTFNGGYIKKMN